MNQERNKVIDRKLSKEAIQMAKTHTHTHKKTFNINNQGGRVKGKNTRDHFMFIGGTLCFKVDNDE